MSSNSPAARSWPKFYDGREGGDYLEYVDTRYHPHIQMVLRHIKANDIVLEAGIGTGTITAALIKRVPVKAQYVGLDTSFEMLSKTYQRLPYIRLGLEDIREICWPCQVVHGHGVLEHFSDNDIRRTIEAHRESGARVAIHYVPGEKYVKPSFGDERLLSTNEWFRIASPSVIHTFNDGFDYILVWYFEENI